MRLGFAQREDEEREHMSNEVTTPPASAPDASNRVPSGDWLGEVWLVWQHDPHYLGGDTLLCGFSREFDACLESEQRNEREEDSHSYYVTRLPLSLPNAAVTNFGANKTP